MDAHPHAARALSRRTLHRRVFVLAGVYNIAWGIYSSLDPQWLFRVAGMPAHAGYADLDF